MTNFMVVKGERHICLFWRGRLIYKKWIGTGQSRVFNQQGGF